MQCKHKNTIRLMYRASAGFFRFTFHGLDFMWQMYYCSSEKDTVNKNLSKSSFDIGIYLRRKQLKVLHCIYVINRVIRTHSWILLFCNIFSILAVLLCEVWNVRVVTNELRLSKIQYLLHYVFCFLYELPDPLRDLQWRHLQLLVFFLLKCIAF